MQPIHIFRAGRHGAMSGPTLDFSESDLEASARAYDPKKHEAPIVIGHPSHDAPAYGWIESVTHGRDGLMGAPRQIDAQFAEMVRAEKFKKISASFYTPDSPNNPVPGVYYLRHVGFLGAMPPAVKGLKPVSFAETETGIVEFADWGMETNANLWRRMRDWMLGKFGQEVADQVVPDWQIETMREAARQDDDDPQRAAFGDASSASSTTTQTDMLKQQQLEAENAALKQQLEAATAREKAAEAKKRHDGNVAFCDGLVSGGKLAPKHRTAVVAFLDFAEGGETTLEFSEGDQKRPLGQAFRDFLGDMPKVVEFGEHATKQRAGKTADGAVSYGENVDQDRLAQDAQIRQYMADHKVDYATAAGQVIR